MSTKIKNSTTNLRTNKSNHVEPINDRTFWSVFVAMEESSQLKFGMLLYIDIVVYLR